MTHFLRGININQLGVRSLFGCLFVYVTQEKAYNLVSFSARSNCRIVCHIYFRFILLTSDANSCMD